MITKSRGYTIYTILKVSLDDKLSEELKAIQDPVFLYSEPTDELFKFDKNTGTAFKSSEAEYQTAAIPLPFVFAIGIGLLGIKVYSVKLHQDYYMENCDYLQVINDTCFPY